MTKARHSLQSPVPVFPSKMQLLALQICLSAVVVLSQGSRTNFLLFYFKYFALYVDLFLVEVLLPRGVFR